MLIQNWLNKFFKILFKNQSLAIAGLFCFVFFISSCDLFSRRIFSKVVARVQYQDKEQNLSLQSFSKILAGKLKNLDPLSAKDPVIVKKFKDQILSDFIVDSLIEFWFVESKLSLDSATLEQQSAAVVKKYPSDSAFRMALAAEDISYDDWLSGLRKSHKRQLLFAELQKKIDPVSEMDIKNYFESNKDKFLLKESVLVKSLLLSDEGQADVIKKLSKKISFEKLIQDYSVERPKPADGLYAWVERDSSAELEILFTNKKNELIGPVKMAEGLRLFKVVQRKAARQRSLEGAAAQIKNEILSLRETARFSAWLDTQIKRYTVYKNTAALDAISVETRED